MIPWPYVKDPQDEEVLEVEVPLDWLGSETLESASVTKRNSDLTVGTPTIQGNLVRFTVSGGTPRTHLLDVTVSTPTRTRNKLTSIHVKES